MKQASQDSAETVARIGRFFELCLTLLVSTTFGANVFAGVVDPFTLCFVSSALVLRLLRSRDIVDWSLSTRVGTALALAFMGFYPIDILYVSGDFVGATLRLLFLFTGLKLLVARRNRDYFYLSTLAMLQLMTASMFIAGMSFLVILLTFLVLSGTTYATFEVKRGCERATRSVESDNSRRRMNTQLTVLGTALGFSILVVSVGLFFVLPRARSAASPLLRGDFAVGFSAEVNLGQTGELIADHTPVMRVEAVEGGPFNRLRWKGLVFHHFDGVRWTAPNVQSRVLSATSGAYAGRNSHRRTLENSRRVRYRVALEPLSTDSLFVPGEPESLTGAFKRLIYSDMGGFRMGETPHSTLNYQGISWVVDRSKLERAPVAELFSDRFRQLYLQAPDFDPRVMSLMDEVTDSAATSLLKAQLLERYFQTEFGYTLDLPDFLPEDPTAHFLFERREGHCEYFASAMALMLRLHGIPTRLVNGFAGGIENPLTGLHVLRSSDAHSWVEAYIPGYGWLEFDPTPERPAPIGGAWMMSLWLYWDAIQSAWMEWVVDYDMDQQIVLAKAVRDRTQSAVMSGALVLEKLQQAGRRILEALVALRGTGSSSAIGWKWPVGVVLLATAVWLLVTWAGNALPSWRLRRGRAKPEDASFAYLQALRLLEAKGFTRREDQTAEEFAASIEDRSLSQRFGALVDSYNHARFGRDREAERRLPELLMALQERV